MVDNHGVIDEKANSENNSAHTIGQKLRKKCLSTLVK